MLRRGAVLFAVQHEVDAPLAEQVHRLRTMATSVVKSKLAQCLAQAAASFVVHGKFEEFDAIECCRRGQGGCARLCLDQK